MPKAVHVMWVVLLLLPALCAGFRLGVPRFGVNKAFGPIGGRQLGLDEGVTGLDTANILPAHALRCHCGGDGMRRRAARSVIARAAGGNSDDDGMVEMKRRLRAEAESPFLKVRGVFFGFSAVSAGVAALISTSRIVAALSGIEIQPLEETVPNLLIDLGVVAGSVWVLQRDRQAEASRVERISRGATLAQLTARCFDPVAGARRTTPMSEFRRSKSVILVAGTPAVAEEVIRALSEPSLASKLSLLGGVVVIPVCLRGEVEVDEADLPDCVGLPTAAALRDWRQYFAKELEGAEAQGISDAVERGIVLSLKKNGKIARRSIGIPNWASLVSELASVK